MAGRRTRVPKCAAKSRAMPMCESASARLGVTLTSRTSSTAPMEMARSSPGSDEGDRIKIPSPCSPSPISGSLHSMPGDITPRTSRASRVLPPGSRAPGCAQHTRFPGGGTLGAPHTTSSSRLPARTRTIRSLSALGCGRMSSTSATTTPDNSRPLGSMPSTSSPWPVNALATRSASVPGGSSTSSRSQFNEIFMSYPYPAGNC